MPNIPTPINTLQFGFSSLVWDHDRQVFFQPGVLTPTGQQSKRKLTAKAVRKAIDNDIFVAGEMMLDVGEDLKTFAEQYLSEEISETQWRAAVAVWRKEIFGHCKNINLNYVAAARGGFHNMEPEHFGRAGGMLLFHAKKLDAFAQEIVASPEIVLNLAPGKMSFEARSKMYATTALATFERERVASHTGANYKYYRNVPTSSESCHSKGATIGCAEITAKGWVPIGSEPDVGKRTCDGLDQCSWEFAKELPKN